MMTSLRYQDSSRQRGSEKDQNQDKDSDDDKDDDDDNFTKLKKCCKQRGRLSMKYENNN